MLRVSCRLAACLIAASLLGACGNKGPLVLPDQQPAAKKTSLRAAPPATPVAADATRAAAAER